MAKKLIIIAAIAATLVLYFIPALCQEAENMGAAFENKQRPVSQFDHEAHMELVDMDCGACHHMDGSDPSAGTSEGIPCSDCHDLEGADDGPPALMAAFHNQCKGCHQEQGKGPVACGECHVR